MRKPASAYTPSERPMASDDTVYITDNGRCCCGLHLGASARWTLHDISGQRIEAITPEIWRSEGWPDWLKCEECGRAPSLLHPAPALVVAR